MVANHHIPRQFLLLFFKIVIFFFLISMILALLDFVSRAIVVAQGSVVRPLTQIAQKPLHGSRSNFMGSYMYLSSVSPERLSLPKFSFSFFFFFLGGGDFFFVNMGLYEG